jgi:hypothetical protein
MIIVVVFFQQDAPQTGMLGGACKCTTTADLQQAFSCGVVPKAAGFFWIRLWSAGGSGRICVALGTLDKLA